MIPEVTRYEYPSGINVDVDHPILKQWKVIEDYFTQKGEPPFTLDEKQQTTPMNMAVCEENLELCKKVIELGGNPNLFDVLERTALHVAAHFNTSSAITELLVENRAVIDAKANVQQTPLMIAVTEKNKKIAVYLLRHGANPNATDSTDWTALHYACLGGDLKICKKLLEFHADLSIKNKKGQTPLELAKELGMGAHLQSLFQSEALQSPTAITIFEEREQCSLIRHNASA